ncbi:MAG: hypothetical protein ACK5XN_09470 [Bacteroidota bacterium]|jgi:hypothetical protein
MEYYLDEGALLRREGQGYDFEIYVGGKEKWQRYDFGNPFVTARPVTEAQALDYMKRLDEHWKSMDAQE